MGLVPYRALAFATAPLVLLDAICLTPALAQAAEIVDPAIIPSNALPDLADGKRTF
jgi:hypothetical protein